MTDTYLLKPTELRSRMHPIHPSPTPPATLPASRYRGTSRNGSVLGVLAVTLPIMTMLAAFCINTAQIQLARTELMVATDAAAKAGGRAFSELQSTEAAKDAAAVTAARNLVQGQPLILQSQNSANEIEFGRTEQVAGESGRYAFIKVPTEQVEQEIQLANAVRVTGRRDQNSQSGEADFYLPNLLSMNAFSVVQDSTAMQVDRDIALVLDRSGSMGEVYFDWQQGQSPWYYSVLNAAVSEGILIWYNYNYYYASGVDSVSYRQWVWESYYNNGPAPTSAWEDLEVAVHAFLDVLDATTQEEQVAIASYSSSASLNITLERDYDQVRSTLAALNPSGMTAIGEGMLSGEEAFNHSSARPFAAKTMVVMTDGIHNTGINPDDVAELIINSSDIRIHTITFGQSADQQLMQEVAQIGGGKHYHADDAEELILAFQEIANNLPTILIE